MGNVRGVKLHKFLVAEFEPNFEDSFSIVQGSVTVSSNVSLDHGKKKYRLIEISKKITNNLTIDRKGSAIISKSILSEMEKAAQFAVDIICVSDRSKVKLYSPRDYLAFSCTTQTAKDWLDNVTSVKLPHYEGPQIAPSFLRIAVSTVSVLSDRPDGFRLLASGLSNNNAIAEFNDYLRLIERAFRSPLNDNLMAKLVRLLDPEFGYTEDELRSWVNLRGRTFHADQRSPEKFAYSKDIEHVVFRVSQAAYDVLLNKKNWNSPDTARTNRWFPNVGTKTEDNHLYLTRGMPANFPIKLTDQAGRDLLPFLVGDTIKNTGKDYVWLPFVTNPGNRSGRMHVIEKREDSLSVFMEEQPKQK